MRQMDMYIMDERDQRSTNEKKWDSVRFFPSAAAAMTDGDILRILREKSFCVLGKKAQFFIHIDFLFVAHLGCGSRTD